MTSAAYCPQGTGNTHSLRHRIEVTTGSFLCCREESCRSHPSAREALWRSQMKVRRQFAALGTVAAWEWGEGIHHRHCSICRRAPRGSLPCESTQMIPVGSNTSPSGEGIRVRYPTRQGKCGPAFHGSDVGFSTRPRRSTTAHEGSEKPVWDGCNNTRWPTDSRGCSLAGRQPSGALMSSIQCQPTPQPGLRADFRRCRGA